jgi:hypothetical protein
LVLAGAVRGRSAFPCCLCCLELLCRHSADSCMHGRTVSKMLRCLVGRDRSQVSVSCSIKPTAVSGSYSVAAPAMQPASRRRTTKTVSSAGSSHQTPHHHRLFTAGRQGSLVLLHLIATGCRRSCVAAANKSRVPDPSRSGLRPLK